MDFHLDFGFRQGVDTNKFYATTTIATCNKLNSVMVASGAGLYRCCQKYQWTKKKDPWCKLASNWAKESEKNCKEASGVWVPPAAVTAEAKNKKEIFGCFLEDAKLQVSTDEKHEKNCGQDKYKKCFCLQPCNTGTYGSYDHKDCQSCVVGRYSDKTGLVKSTDAIPCAICPKGKWQDTAGSTSCKDW